MHKNRSQGFTLIELLVVIAIIGILSAVVLASLNTARDKGNDAKIQTQIQSVQTAAEIYYSTKGNYGASANCQSAGMGIDTDSGFKNLMTADNYPDKTAPVCTTDSATAATKWSAYHVLSSAAANGWCSDSTGQSKQILMSAVPTAGAACP